MKTFVRSLVCAAVVAAGSSSVLALSANDAGDIVRAQMVISKVLAVVSKFQTQSVVLTAPDPIHANTGRYLLPYKENGEPTEWAVKMVSAQVGKLVGEKAGDAATRAVASKVPFGGLASGLIKKKTKEVAAVTALGGPEFLKKTSDLSFNDLNAYAVYLHVKHSADSNYQQVLATAIAVYPDLEKGFDAAIQQAYSAAAKANKA